MTVLPIDQVDEERWHEKRRPVEMEGREMALRRLIDDLVENAPLKGDAYQRVMRRHVQQGLPWLSKSKVITAYEALCDLDLMDYSQEVVTALQKKPTRSQAGVTVVTVLTKPYPCPGKCIFCPTDVRMPKSYLHDEPGAMRAERHAFDPYAQTAARMAALENIGHPADKIELLILGGTWSSYPRNYQEWFVKRCLDAMNGVESATLAQAQARNARGRRRNVGLVVETRPDHVDEDELRWFRTLGVTKVQIGIQSLDDRILALNRRGETVQDVRNAVRLLRLAGFKIHVHWMPNLLGATPESDVEDFGRLWSDFALRPDELKIYPCMLLPNAELYDYWQRGEYHPYSDEEILDVLVACKTQVPRYVRINRIVRDIPTTNVVAGISKANLRQIAQQRMARQGLHCCCIRCREIRRQTIDAGDLSLRVDSYETDATTEYFLSFERDDERIAGFLRLSHPRRDKPHAFPELDGQAMIREVHVYGPAVPIGEESQGEAQHVGLGTQLVQKAVEMSREAGYSGIAVISAIGTQEYYARHGFGVEGLYMKLAIG
jgi:elongator complex protein 3